MITLNNEHDKAHRHLLRLIAGDSEILHYVFKINLFYVEKSKRLIITLLTLYTTLGPAVKGLFSFIFNMYPLLVSFNGYNKFIAISKASVHPVARNT